MIYFPTSPKQCFCTTLQNRQTQKLHLFTQCHMIIILETLKTRLCMDCLLIVSFRYRNSLQQVLEMFSLRANTPLQTLSPLADSSVNNTLLQTAPNVNQSPLEFVDIVDLHLVHTLLHDPPNLIISGVQVRTVGGHSSGEMKSAVSCCRSSIVSRARCAGAERRNCHPQHV